MNWFYWLFPGMFLPLFLIASCWKIYPTGRTALLVLPSILLAFLFFCVDAAEALWLINVYDLILGAFLGFDLLSTALFKDFRVERSVERIASLAVALPIRIRIENRTGRNQIIMARDDLLPEFTLIKTDLSAMESVSSTTDKETLFQDKSEIKRLIPNGMAEEIRYQLFPNKRGAFQLEYVYLTLFGLLGCWKKMRKIPCQSEIFVYPNLQQISQYDLLARSQRLHQLGFRKARRIGVDHDFERLRDYTTDDQYKFIDWSATAKRNRLTVKDFQMSRNQRIIFMIDAGRMMTNLYKISSEDSSTAKQSPFSASKVGSRFFQPATRSVSSKNSSQKISLLDSSFNAMLMLAYIALKQGDEVGFLCFSNRVRQYIPPRAGLNQMNHLIHGSFDLFPEPVESRYDLAFSWLSRQCRKRSLLVFMTNINDERNSTQIEAHLTNLTGRHLPLGIFIRDHALFRPIEKYEELLQKYQSESLTSSEKDQEQLFDDSGNDQKKRSESFESKKGTNIFDPVLQKNPQLFYQAAAASEILNWRHKTIRELAAKGTLTMDVFPEQMTASLINKYLEIKARHLL